MNFTNRMFDSSGMGFLDNTCQTKAKRLVFVCSAGMLRSPTAQIVASKMGYNARACGSNAKIALIPLNANLIEWADHIVFMHFTNYCQALNTFEGTGYDETIRQKKIVWDTPDDYHWCDEWLMKVIEMKLEALKL